MFLRRRTERITRKRKAINKWMRRILRMNRGGSRR